MSQRHACQNDINRLRQYRRRPAKKEGNLYPVSFGAWIYRPWIITPIIPRAFALKVGVPNCVKVFARSTDLTKETSHASLRRREVGEFLRSRRLALDPKELGLTRHAYRRHAGLGREQVADLAGISADWYGRLEGGLETNPSRRTLRALTGALRLTNIETRFVFELAGFAEPDLDAFSNELSEAVLDYLILDPVRVGIYMMDVYLTPLKWNAIANGLWRFSAADTPIERNFMYRLADPYVVSLLGSAYELTVRQLVGMFRRAHTCQPTLFSRHVLEVALRAEIFHQFWDEHVVAEQMWPASGPFPRRHPIVGILWINAMSLSVVPARAETVVVLTPADVASAKKLARLRAIGKASQTSE
jgi:transcriptional regulator with XRE-family HTH domain